MNLKPLLTCTILALGAGVLLSQEKSSHASKPTSTSTTNAVDSNFPVIGYIEKQDRTITIKAGAKGTIYSIKSNSGKVLCENLTLEQLRAQAPDLHEFVKSAVAG